MTRAYDVVVVGAGPAGVAAAAAFAKRGADVLLLEAEPNAAGAEAVNAGAEEIAGVPDDAWTLARCDHRLTRRLGLL